MLIRGSLVRAQQEEQKDLQKCRSFLFILYELNQLKNNYFKHHHILTKTITITPSKRWCYFITFAVLYLNH